MIVSASEMKLIEERAFANGASAEDLMERAGIQMAQAVRQFFPQPGVVRVYYGKGNNGGDVLVAARQLALSGWGVRLRPAFPNEQLSELTRKKLGEVSAISAPRIRRKVILDGLLGIGAKGPLRDPVRAAAREINQYRNALNTYVFSADVPTGVDGETGEVDADAVRADFTLSVALLKSGVLADQATGHVGRLCLLPLEELQAPAENGELITPAGLEALLPRRNFDSHKGDFGRVGIVAGSPGFTGAAIMCATAALRAGAGLITLFATPDIYPLVAMQAPPEVMVAPIEKLTDVREKRLDVLALGPGLGLARREEILELHRRAGNPDGGGCRCAQCAGDEDRHAPPVRRAPAAHPASRGDGAADARSSGRAARYFAGVYAPISGDAVAQRRADGDWGARTRARLELDRQPRHGHRRHGRYSYRRLRRAHGAEKIALRCRADRGVDLRAGGGDRHLRARSQRGESFGDRSAAILRRGLSRFADAVVLNFFGARGRECDGHRPPLQQLLELRARQVSRAMG
ncbi:MAG: NAD(P)H-hydrate epimerase [Chthoniobacteraceae bacterium]